MSPAVSLMVFGQVYFLGPVSNSPAITPDTNLTSPIYQNSSQPEPSHVVRRDDYTYAPGIGSYKVHTQVANWHKARDTCEKEGGYLAIINSVAESQLLMKLFQNSGSHAGTSAWDFVHIGFHDLYTDGEYVTVHGEPVESTGFNEWALGGPNNGDDGGEDCGSIYYFDGKLNDISCKKSCGFICELP